MNLGVLNTVIAMVIVLLVLSLIVQAIQGFIKKVLKLKSHEIEGSLEDLYEQALSNATDRPSATGASATPAANVKASSMRWLKTQWICIRKVLGDKSAGSENPPKSPAQQFTCQIMEEFKDIGRSSKWGNAVLDSLSKEDLLKIMAKLDSESFVPDYVSKFRPMVVQLKELREAIKELSDNKLLTGSASAKLAEIRMVLAPLFNDVQSIVEGEELKPKVLFGDLLRLGNIKLNGVPELLNDAQRAITQEIEVAGTDTERAAALRTLSNELAKIARLIGNLSQEFDNAMMPLRIKLAQVETWYDTVMQSFDERYARHMKSVALYISMVVVVLLNANFFTVYSNLSKNQVRTNLIVQNGEQVLDASRKANETATPTPTETPTPVPTATPTPTEPTALTLSASATATATPLVAPTLTPSAAPSPSPEDLKKQVEETKQNIDTYVNMYEQFGFSPLSAEQARAWLWSTGVWTMPWGDERGGFWGFTVARNEKGVPVTGPIKGIRRPILTDCQEIDSDGKKITYEDGAAVRCLPDWRPLTFLEWWESRKHDVSVLFGWSIMILLLSVGAPFWQDTLESLFGVKNLLRQKSGTQNIETKSGAGQPKQS